ncbi:polyprenyl diphosphate synthase [Streptomyces sp. NBC_00576]|uniref:polyprenyl diphosphate synthase n=1 Tax=Streptomyces sp. NBC_00576 TaxID=2903665 RepID=UPI002E81265C|nr:polyprenyl diphosphate synthase [Streptomyces sp. NBC_00576]WUB76964.1 polyprenyl diphosphate synthase [Streptomyces sp. NBC_00576]
MTSPTAHAPLTAPPQQQPVLRHLALIPDGNRRWARAKNLPTTEGHRRGGERCLDVLQWCSEYPEIETVSLAVCSIENLARRPEVETRAFARVITELIRQTAATRRWRINLMGNPDMFGPAVSEVLHEAVTATADVSGPVANFAVAYSGRDELLQAVNQLMRASTTKQSAVSAHDIERHLDTAGQPDCDLMIRTAGVAGLCGFMPWQGTYSQQYVSATDWPEFAESDLARAVASYHSQERRMGG